MSDLLDAIEAEARGDFAAALPHYEKLTTSGSALDRVGIHQALARCNEKLGRLKDGGRWRRKAGQGYVALSDDEMARTNGSTWPSWNTGMPCKTSMATRLSRKSPKNTPRS